MSIAVAELNRHIAPTQTLARPKQQSGTNSDEVDKQQFLLQAAIENFVDGILILTEQGEWVYANTQAHRICHQLSQYRLQPNTVAQEIWRVGQSLVESHQMFRDRNIMIESKIATDSSVTYRIRARWLELTKSDAYTGLSQGSFVLVTLEEQYQATQNRVFNPINRYGLTRREAEVWLLRQANHSYKEIADKLYITLNTVKKHLKNIYAKQQMHCHN